MDIQDCVMRKSHLTCKALKNKDCTNCSFYKSKTEYKPYYYIDNNGQKQVGYIKRR